MFSGCHSHQPFTKKNVKESKLQIYRFQREIDEMELRKLDDDHSNDDASSFDNSTTASPTSRGDRDKQNHHRTKQLSPGRSECLRIIHCWIKCQNFDVEVLNRYKSYWSALGNEVTDGVACCTVFVLEVLGVLQLRLYIIFALKFVQCIHFALALHLFLREYYFHNWIFDFLFCVIIKFLVKIFSAWILWLLFKKMAFGSSIC